MPCVLSLSRYEREGENIWSKAKSAPVGSNGARVPLLGACALPLSRVVHTTAVSIISHTSASACSNSKSRVVGVVTYGAQETLCATRTACAIRSSRSCHTRALVRARVLRAFHNAHEAPWLILPVVICLSQRLSHACLSACRIKVKPRMAH